MSIFEDLIEELKEENLIEETVIEFHKEKPQPVQLRAEAVVTEKLKVQNFSKPQETQPLTQFSVDTDEAAFSQVEFTAEELYPVNEITVEDTQVIIEDEDDFTAPLEVVSPAEDAKSFPEVDKPKIFVSEKEYFRKRAMDEVTGLQMVDHVLSGIEREQMKVVPKPYDDLPVKLALHDFLQDAHDANTTEHAQSEFKLMQETENWYSALSNRDKQITIAQLRRYCETTRPALSSQALIALSRFYRNSPFTESVRSKFELVVTRLFSQEIEEEKRELLLDHFEMIGQIKELYADWSSIQLYSADEDDSNILISTMKFEDFVNEAQNTENFDDLISKDFFNRLRMFKEECNENFFAPQIVVAAIETNVKIGNRYIDLLNKEKEKFNNETLEEKYGFLHDQLISDATGKTLELISLLNSKNEASKREKAEIVEVSVKEQEKRFVRTADKESQRGLLGVNRWLLAATLLTILSCGGLYFWAEMETQNVKPSPSVRKVSLEGSEFNDYIQTARISSETFFGVTTDVWENLNTEKKEEMLKKLMSIGTEKNFKKVHLVNSGGKSVGFASSDKSEVYNQ